MLLSTLGSSGQASIWDFAVLDNYGDRMFSLVPGSMNAANFSFGSTLLMGPVEFNAPVLPANSSTVAPELTVVLPQSLLCLRGTTTIINEAQGTFPSVNHTDIVRAPGTACSWVLSYGTTAVDLRIDYSGLAPGDALTVSVDGFGSVARLVNDGNAAGNSSLIYTARLDARNVTLRYVASPDGTVMGRGPVVTWTGVASTTPSPPPDTSVATKMTVRFNHSALIPELPNLPNSRRWQANVYPVNPDNTTAEDPVFVLNDTYATEKNYYTRFQPGVFQILITDALLPSVPLLSVKRRIWTLDSPTARVLWYLDVPLVRVIFRQVYFSSVMVSPGPGFMVNAACLVSVYTSSELLTNASAQPSALDLWDQDFTSLGAAAFSLIPSLPHMVTLSYGPKLLLRGPFTINSPAFSNTSTALVLDYELPQTVLCASGTTTLIHQPKASYPLKDAGTIVYGPAIACAWVIITGQPAVDLTLNYTGLAPGDFLTVTTAAGLVTRLPGAGNDTGVFKARLVTTNVTIRFRAGFDGGAGTPFSMAWEGVGDPAALEPASPSPPPPVAPPPPPVVVCKGAACSPHRPVRPPPRRKSPPPGSRRPKRITRRSEESQG
ncbi:hypothetical protein HYH03_014610 [Edaphochlamys debaryana]|uniref:CUB domain-containing protein n=1 Tax=Edaphochlamys debaryana TaxID=47281 RepID=A0A835XTL8_9CHLO|nr:hypothetical protein HYH03_014610 [Edaphochlamys debaryana]|eukprot:KAG2486680.1 hypothetical protein HYH03_014610 [Edaphochlamys debaryana]